MDSLIIFAAKYLVFVIALIAAFVFARATPEQRRFFMASGLVSTVVGFIMVLLAGHLYFHQRPFAVYHIPPLVSHPDDNGFPSEHTFISMLMAFVVAQISWRWGLGLFVLALAVGWGRVAAQVHWPIDIVGGTVIAALAALAGYYAAKPLLKLLAKKAK